MNELVEEYQQCLYLVHEEKPLRLTDLTAEKHVGRDGPQTGDNTGPIDNASVARLPVFISDTECFQFAVTDHVHAIIDCLDMHLLRPNRTTRTHGGAKAADDLEA